MSLLKGRELERFLLKPATDVVGTLIFGPEEGLVSERADSLLAAYQKLGFEPVRLSAEAYKADGMHLEALLKSDSLFAPRQVFLLEDTAHLQRHMRDATDTLLETPHCLIIVAGDLKKSSQMRVQFESAPRLAAMACYMESQSDLASYVSSRLSDEGFSISFDDRSYLISLLSDNRLVNRGEIDKLLLYAHGNTEVTRADIEAVLGDVGLARLDDVIDLAMTGDRARLCAELVRFQNMAVAEELVFATLSRHLDQLLTARLSEARGNAGEGALKAGFGYVHFSRKDRLTAQLRLWDIPALEEALGALASLELSLRLQPDLKMENLERFLLRLSALARRRS